MKFTHFLFVLFIFSIYTTTIFASKLIEVLPVDNQCLLVHWQDGYVQYNWDDTTSGSCNGWDYFYTEKWSLCPDKDEYIPFGAPLNTQVVQHIDNFRLRSSEDGTYGESGLSPMKVHRKSKVWEACHDERKPAMHHWIYLELPHPMRRGVPYSLTISAEIGSDLLNMDFTFDEFALESPSIKISNIGYEATAVHKNADVYLWMGDGGGRDFSHLQGAPWHLYNVQSKQVAHSGMLKYRKAQGVEPSFDVDFTKSGIWECDFSSFSEKGQYKLVVEGIGSSAPFVIDDNLFEEPFKVAMQGMFYQRMGCDDAPPGNFPKARRPLFRQGVDPAGFKVFISERNMVTGTNPDNRNWYSEALSGELAEATWGGWCDAYDNDQRPVNFICVFDLLLAYYLNPGVFRDDHLYIPEVNNGIPDIIDEALWEIDWWLRMRDGSGGYLTGLTNILPPQNVNYAGAACAWQGWCVAAGCAMAADCFRLAGHADLQKAYADSAIVAYRWAGKQTDTMLDVEVSGLRGRDLKMTAAAFLYNLTGEEGYEQVILEESEVTSAATKIRNMGQWEQQYATLAYILTPQKVQHPSLHANMQMALINQAKSDYVEKMDESPTKAARWPGKWEGMIQTSNEMSLVAIAHRITQSAEEKAYFEKGMYAEGEWTLGRNPLGLVQMTGLSDRSITQTFAPGRRDGYPGVTPGWTPYMCRDGWNNDDDIHRCGWYTNRNYPADKELWPYGEHFWNSRYCVPNSETTPQQTFRQKIVLYSYLYGLSYKRKD